MERTPTRRNANDVDLNADGGSLSQPESRALMTFTALVRPALTIHAHSPNGFVGWYGPSPSTAVARAISTATGMRSAYAGQRPDRSRWFLWQGQSSVYVHPIVLVEFFAVSNSEVPNANPRPSTQTVQAVSTHAARLLGAIVATL